MRAVELLGQPRSLEVDAGELARLDVRSKHADLRLEVVVRLGDEARDLRRRARPAVRHDRGLRVGGEGRRSASVAVYVDEPGSQRADLEVGCPGRPGTHLDDRVVEVSYTHLRAHET